MTLRPFLLATLGLAAAGLAATAFYTVAESEVALVTRFGRPLPGVARPGLHAKLPWPVDTVVRLDARLLLFDNEPTEMLTADKKNVLLDSFVAWRIADPLLFTQTVKTRAEAEARLLDLASSELGAAVGRATMESFLNTAGPVRLQEISRHAGTAVGALARRNFGIEVVDLRINGFNLPEQNRASVIERMRAERARIATRYRSEGEEAALKIQARAAAERETLLATARAEAEAVRGRGEADALRLFAAAYAKDPDLYRFLRSLESYETILDEKTTLFLSSDSQLLKALDGR